MHFSEGKEKILLPAFENATGQTSGPTQVMRWEHQQIRGFLRTIAGKLAPGQDDTGDDESGLLAVLGMHNQKEENIPYPMIDRIVDGEQRAELFAAMEQQK